jgi:hypothetical protein
MPILTPPNALAVDVRYRCDCCGHEGEGFPANDKGERFASDYAQRGTEGAIVCARCANAAEVADMAKASDYVAYINGAGDTLTTWTGHPLARVVDSTPCTLSRQSHAHNSKGFRSWRFRAPDGSEWYGRGSAGIVCKVRRAKAKPDNITTHAGIVSVEYVSTSANGNPRRSVTVTTREGSSEVGTTRPDCPLGYSARNYAGKHCNVRVYTTPGGRCYVVDIKEAPAPA